ncbi:hypothetical protein ACWDR1_34945 [Streptosporangium sandarakinum]
MHATGAQIAAALTLSILIAAVCAPLVGRLLDAHGGRALMTIGSVLGAAAVLAWSRVESLPQRRWLPPVRSRSHKPPDTAG